MTTAEYKRARVYKQTVLYDGIEYIPHEAVYWLDDRTMEWKLSAVLIDKKTGRSTIRCPLEKLELKKELGSG